MAYQELIKHFQRIRDYMHEFYIYGFKSREHMLYKSQRSYDNEKRRLESYLKGYMTYQYQSSKLVFLSIDNRHIPHNPLYKAFQSKSFTDKSITLHFILFDIFYDETIILSLKEIIEQIDIYLSAFEHPHDFDESTIRKKLNEYIKLGLFKIIKDHQNMYQRCSSFSIKSYQDALLFYSEIDPLGVIGSYLLQRHESQDIFSFKHHYIAYAIDSEIIFYLFSAMKQKSYITINLHNPKTHKDSHNYVVPLKIYISSQTGRSHLLAYHSHAHTVKTFRIDYIDKVVIQDRCPRFDEYRHILNQAQPYMWSIQYTSHHLEHVEFIIEIQKGEQYIYRRLLREKRIGNIVELDQYHYQFIADVCDTYELIPWMRTFICRITQLNFSNRTAENCLKEDIKRMYEMYEIGDDE